MSDNETPAPPDNSDELARIREDEPDDSEPTATDLIDPSDGTAGGGTATADALLGAQEVDEQLGDEAPDRPERGPRDESRADASLVPSPPNFRRIYGGAKVPYPNTSSESLRPATANLEEGD